VNVIIDACNSGSFISLPQKVTKPGRVVITSTSADAPAWTSGAGVLFSDAFFSALGEGMSLFGAFDAAERATLLSRPDQTPWLDSDGDELPNEQKDWEEAARRGFSHGHLPDGEWIPYVVQVEVRGLEGGRGEIWAEVRDDVGVDDVWAVVYPPSYVSPQPSDELVAEPLPVTLHAQGNDWYGGLYGAFDEAGLYQVIVYATDEGALKSRPRKIEVRTGWSMYLPALCKAK
jgi:hypothetical protein